MRDRRSLGTKGTCRVEKIAGRRRVVVGVDDPSLTPCAGLGLVAELDRALGIVAEIDRSVGPVKERRQGLGAGGLLVSMAESMLSGGDFISDLDSLRCDVAGRDLRAVCDPPSPSTFIALTKRFDDAVFDGVEAAVAVLNRAWFERLGPKRREALAAARPTLDLDPTDVEVFGEKKEGVAFNYEGKRVGRPHPVVWAEAGVVVAAELGDGATDPRPQAPGLVRRGAAGLPPGLGRPIVRADSAFFASGVAKAAVAEGCDFMIAAKRNPAAWAAVAAVPERAWSPAVSMTGAEVAVCRYRPARWPEGTRCVVRRVRVDAGEVVGRDGRARRRRTIAPGQLRLVLDGEAGHAYAYTFIMTNVDWVPVALEWHFRQRALVEERIKDTKAGMALRHLPSGKQAVNRAWAWAAFLATNVSAWLQSLAGTDRNGRSHGKRLRRELVCLPARALRHAGATVLRFPPGRTRELFTGALYRLRALPSAWPRPG